MTRHTNRARRALTLLAALSLTAGFSISAHAQGIGPKVHKTFIVNTTTDAHDATSADDKCIAGPPAAGKCTLRAAIEQANNGPGTGLIYTIIVPPGHYYLPLGTLVVTNNTVNIYGNGAPRTIIDRFSGPVAATNTVKPDPVSIFVCLQTGSVFRNESNLFIQGAEITHGSHDYGGGVQNLGSLILNWDLVDYNCADYGGGVNSSSESAAAQISNTEISNNDATNDGGGVRNRGGKMTLDGDNIHDNDAGTAGGGVWNDRLLSINNGAIFNNDVGSVEGQIGDGGGIYNEDHLEVSDTRILDNLAGFNGGGLDNSGNCCEYASLDLVTMKGNMAGSSGGGAYNQHRLYISRSTISNNTAGSTGGLNGNGGGVASVDDVWLTDSKVIGNQAVAASGSSVSSGGGLFSDDENWVTRTSFMGNTADDGGGIEFIDSYCNGCFATRFTLQGSTLTGNTANVLGGGMNITDQASALHPPAPVRINDSTLTGNAGKYDLANPPGTAVCSGATTIGSSLNQC